MQVSSLPETQIRVGAADIRVTVADLEAIQRALAAHLAETRPLLERRIAPDVLAGLPPAAGRAWIDPSRAARIGLWQLTEHRGRLVLAAWRSPRTGAVLDRYVAGVENTQGTWRVTGVSVETFYAK